MSECSNSTGIPWKNCIELLKQLPRKLSFISLKDPLPCRDLFEEGSQVDFFVSYGNQLLELEIFALGHIEITKKFYRGNTAEIMHQLVDSLSICENLKYVAVKVSRIRSLPKGR